MLTKFFRMIEKSCRFGKTISEKVSILNALCALTLKKRVYEQRLNEECTQRVLGYTITAYGYKTLQYLFQEIFLSNEYYFEALNETPTIIDCGANIGVSVLYFKRLYPNARILAFEPNPHAFRLLEKNIARNDIKNVSAFNFALSDKDGEIAFYCNEDMGTLKGSLRRDRGGGTEMKVKSVRLSEFIDKLETRVDLIKIDVEGGENEIITDLCASRAIEKIDEIVIEYHHKIGDEPGNFSEFLGKFEQNKFDYNLSALFLELRTFQDILIHFYR